MGVGLLLARRNLTRKFARTLFSILGIAVGIATVVGVFTLDHNTIVGRSKLADSSWQAEIEVSPSAAVKDPSAELARVPGVTAFAAAFQTDVVIHAAENGSAARARLVAIEPEHAADIGSFALQSGEGLRPRSEESLVLLGDELARNLGVRAGDRLFLSRPRIEPGKDCVEGEWRAKAGHASAAELPVQHEFVVQGVLAREGVGRISRGEVAVIDYRLGARIFEGVHVDRRYWLKHDKQVDLERIQSALGRAWSYDLKKSVIIGQAADERAFRNGVRFAGLFAMVLGLYVIFHTLSMALVERVREIGVLHALGATRAQLARIFLLEAVLVALAGGGLGLAAGLWGARACLRVGITTVGAGEHITFFEVPWATVLSLAATGVGIALAGSIYPLARLAGVRTVLAQDGRPIAARSGPQDALTRGFRLFSVALLVVLMPALYLWLVPVVGEAQAELVGILMVGLGILALFVALPLLLPGLLAWLCGRLAGPFERRFPLAGKLAARGMRDAPLRVAGAVSALALVTAAYVGLRGMTQSLEAEVRTWGEQAFLDKVYVRNLPDVEFAALVEQLRRYPGVLGVEPNAARTYVPFLILGVDVDQLAGYGPCRDHPALLGRLAQEQGLILSRRLARHRDYAVGDSVHVKTPSGGVLSLPVIAISDAYGYFPHPDERLYAVVDQRVLDRHFCIGSKLVRDVAVRLAPGTDASVVETAVGEFVPEARGVNFEDGPYLYRWYTTDIARDFILFDLVLAGTVLLAALGVLNGQLLAALERAKELGVLRALGATRAQIAGMVALEAALIGTTAGFLGVVLGSALAPVIVRALRVVSGLPLPLPGLSWHHGIAAAGAVVLALVSVLYPLWRMVRSNPAQAVRSG
ncbi:MAG: FtsX-like permease family protein [Planctomycetes bacterium]|nr:FtsX-like permease family protein [Planctomycetota bacterium]